MFISYDVDRVIFLRCELPWLFSAINKSSRLILCLSIVFLEVRGSASIDAMRLELRAWCLRIAIYYCC